MADTHIVSGLKTLRAEKLGEMQHLLEKLSLLEADIKRVETVIGHVDGVLKEVAPNEDVTSIQPVRSRRHTEPEIHTGAGRRSKAGGTSVPQHVLRVLRQEGIPLTVQEIVELVMKYRPNDRPIRVANCARGCLKLKVEEGLLDRTENAEGVVRYAVKR